MIPDLSNRFDGPEFMDQPDCNQTHLYRTLAQFQWVNLVVSRYKYFLKRWIISDMMQNPAQTHHLIDLGAGGCDIPVWLLTHCHHLGLQLKITAIDADPRTVLWAQQRYQNIANLTIRCDSAFNIDSFSNADYVYSNHFLHHLPNHDIIRLFNLIHHIAKRRALVCDLRRSRFSYVGFSLLAKGLLRNSFSYEDGRISIRKGFTKEELQHLVNASRMRDTYQICRAFPGRLAVVDTKFLDRP